MRSKFDTRIPQYEENEEFSDGGYVSTDSFQDKTAESDDEMKEISFGALSKAQRTMRKQAEEESKLEGRQSNSHKESYRSASNRKSVNEQNNQRNIMKARKAKHAPREASAKEPVSSIREISGLERKSMHRDIRFDTAYGKADLRKARSDYAFLDEIREREIKEAQELLKTNKHLSKDETDALTLKIQSLRSRLDSLRNRDLETKILADHKRDQMKKFKKGEQVNPYFLKRSDKRKLLQKAKFDSMKPAQREKVIERKRKRRLGKELRALEFKH